MLAGEGAWGLRRRHVSSTRVTRRRRTYSDTCPTCLIVRTGSFKPFWVRQPLFLLLLPQVSASASSFYFYLRIYLSFLILSNIQRCFVLSFDTCLPLSSRICVADLGFLRRLLYAFFQEFALSLISLFSFPMSISEDQNPISTPEVVPMRSKITEDELTGPNYSDWSKQSAST